MNVSFFSMKGETFFVFVPQHRPSSFSLSSLVLLSLVPHPLSHSLTLSTTTNYLSITRDLPDNPRL